MKTPKKRVRPDFSSVNLDQHTRERFLSRVVRDGPIPDQSKECYAGLGPCWTLEKIGKTPNGYGLFYIDCATTLAHRVSWSIHRGLIPEGMYVLHRCDNPECVNPDHLFLGTHLDNVADCNRKNRQAVGDRHGMRKHPERVARGDNHYRRRIPESGIKGEDHANSKLTEEMVMAMRAEHATVGTSFNKMAPKYGVCAATVKQVVRRLTWKHVI